MPPRKPTWKLSLEFYLLGEELKIVLAAGVNIGRQSRRRRTVYAHLRFHCCLCLERISLK
jgi:hypothetical protein